MKMQFTLAALAALTPLAHAVGNAVIENNCGKPVYVWSVGSSVSDQQRVNPGDIFGEPFRRDPVTGGVTFKVTRVKDGLYNGSPQTNFALSLQDSTIWYDLSDVFGDAFEGESVVVTPENENCPSIEWPTGVPPGESQVRNCAAKSDVTLVLC